MLKRDCHSARIVAIRVPESMEESLFKHLLTMTSVEKQLRISRFHRHADACRALLADCLVRHELGKLLQRDAAAIAFSANQYGKPFALQAEGLHYNATHSGQWVAAVFSSMECGIDVEEIKPSDPLPLANRFFHQAEYEAICNSPEPVRTFYTYWTMKESYIKALGLGLSKNLASFIVHIEDNLSAAVEDLEGQHGYRIHSFQLDSLHAGAVCLPEDCRIDDMIVIDDPVALWHSRC